ncbi:hypothetical protein BOBR111200_25035 [Bordetella bronchialis]
MIGAMISRAFALSHDAAHAPGMAPARARVLKAKKQPLI